MAAREKPNLATRCRNCRAELSATAQKCMRCGRLGAGVAGLVEAARGRAAAPYVVLDNVTAEGGGMGHGMLVQRGSASIRGGGATGFFPDGVLVVSHGRADVSNFRDEQGEFVRRREIVSGEDADAAWMVENDADRGLDIDVRGKGRLNKDRLEGKTLSLLVADYGRHRGGSWVASLAPPGTEFPDGWLIDGTDRRIDVEIRVLDQDTAASLGKRKQARSLYLGNQFARTVRQAIEAKGLGHYPAEVKNRTILALYSHTPVGRMVKKKLTKRGFEHHDFAQVWICAVDEGAFPLRRRS